MNLSPGVRGIRTVGGYAPLIYRDSNPRGKNTALEIMMARVRIPKTEFFSLSPSCTRTAPSESCEILNPWPRSKGFWPCNHQHCRHKSLVWSVEFRAQPPVEECCRTRGGGGCAKRSHNDNQKKSPLRRSVAEQGGRGWGVLRRGVCSQFHWWLHVRGHWYLYQKKM